MLFINAATLGIIVTVWWKMRGLVLNVEKDRSESRWIDRLIYHEAGTFSDLQQQVDAQAQQLSALAAARTNAHAALQTEAADGAAGGDRARQVLGELTTLEAWSFEDELLMEVRREVAAAHARQVVSFQATTAAASSSSSNGQQKCAPAAKLERALGKLMALQTAGHSADYAAQAAGGKVVYSHALTSPSFPSASTQSSLGGTLRHVLGLRAPFPPPESVLGPAAAAASSSAASDFATTVTAASEDAAEDSEGGSGSNGYRAQSWAFAGSAGRFTVKLAKAVAVTHVTVEQRPPSQASRSEETAAPRDFTAWGLRAPSDAAPVKLGAFAFDQQGTPRQTFAAAGATSAAPPVAYVTFDVRSNHGNPDFTCLHQVRVHSSDL